MVFGIILLVISAGMVSWFCYEKVKAYSLKAVLIKSCCSMLFIGLAAYGVYKSGYHHFTPFAIVALALGMLGDIFLEMKYVFKDNNKEFTYAGFVAFALGHVFYITGLFFEFYHIEGIMYAVAPFIFGVFMAFMCMVIEKPFKLKYGAFRFICFLYAITLFSDLGLAFSLTLMTGFQNTSLILIFVGMVLFAASDLILNNTYFGEGHEKPFDLISNTVLYYVAQNLIAFSILCL